jgi:UPF0755 protein
VAQGKKTLPLIRLGGAGLFFLALFLFGAISSRGSEWWVRMVPPGKGVPVEALVEPGQNALAVARSLVEQGLTDGDARTLARWFSLLGMDSRLKPGLYKIRPGTPWEVAKQMQGQEPDSAGVRLIPGTTFKELGTVLSRWGGEKALLRELADPSNFPAEIRGLLPENPEFRLAFLMPDSYRVTPSAVAVRDFVRLASRTWLQKVGPLVPRNVDAHWLLERAILASINEREARDDGERARVAGVFENRLRLGMPLQSCATVIFAWKQKGRVLDGLTYEDLHIDSAYNTYRNKGLPPGPIGAPSFPAWQAATAPEKHDYLFFVLSPSGRHFFSRTYEEHLAAQKAAGQAGQETQDRKGD